MNRSAQSSTAGNSYNRPRERDLRGELRALGSRWVATIHWRRDPPFVVPQGMETFDGRRMTFQYSGPVNYDGEFPDYPLYGDEGAFSPENGEECPVEWIASGDLRDIQRA